MAPRKSSRTSAEATVTARPTAEAASECSADNKPVFFWREYGSEHGYLSQWYLSPFTTEDKSIVYQTAEQYMMYQKAILFNDHEIAAKILETTTPKAQKALGRKVKNFNEHIWLANRERIVEEGTYYKFKYGRGEGEGEEGDAPGLKNKLLGTGDREIVEASPMDRIWGVGFGEKNAESRRKDWGLNLLGKALMKVRERLIAEGEAEKA
jgi:ribA/ribD-fused uncharacterized protein